MDTVLKPPPTLTMLRAKRSAILQLAERYGASQIRVFGSVARGEARADSDVDLLVVFKAGVSLWDMVGLWQDLQTLLGYDVSLITESEIQTRFRERIQADLVPL